MAGNKEGWLKARQTLIRKYGSEEKWREHMKGIGAEGGKNGRTGGFASQFEDDNGLTGPQRASVFGQKGGRAPKHKRSA